MDWTDGFASACHLHLDDPKSAGLVLGESAHSLGTGKEIQKAFLLADLAIAIIRQGDPEQATAMLHQTIDCEGLGGAVVCTAVHGGP
jgi:hypothetical protein